MLERAVARLRELHPRLVFAGYRDGYFSDADEPSVAAEIRAARPDLLFVAMSTPRKEYFLGRWGAELDVPFSMGVGGAIDVVAGVTKRAPRSAAAAGPRVGVPARPGAAAAVPALSGHELRIRGSHAARPGRAQSTSSSSCALSRTTSASASCAAVNGPVATAMQRTPSARAQAMSRGVSPMITVCARG